MWPGSHSKRVIGDMDILLSQVRQNLTQLEILWETLTPPQRAFRVAYTLSQLVGRFIKIHPFRNGNGRTSRLIWGWGMRRFGLPFQVRIAMRPENPRYSEVMAASMRGDFDELAVVMLEHISRFPPNQVVN
jgi:hypothetical protein